jgi:hypothetical protein
VYANAIFHSLPRGHFILFIAGKNRENPIYIWQSTSQHYNVPSAPTALICTRNIFKASTVPCMHRSQRAIRAPTCTSTRGDSRPRAPMTYSIAESCKGTCSNYAANRQCPNPRPYPQRQHYIARDTPHLNNALLIPASTETYVIYVESRGRCSPSPSNREIW